MISYQCFIVILSYHILCFNRHTWIHCMFACLFITYALLLISYAGGGCFLRYVSTNVYDIRIFYTENNKSISDLFWHLPLFRIGNQKKCSLSLAPTSTIILYKARQRDIIYRKNKTIGYSTSSRRLLKCGGTNTVAAPYAPQHTHTVGLGEDD